MPLISDQFKDELLARVDLVSVISQYVQLRKAGERHYGLCPFHEEKTASFAVHARRQFYYCFGCQASGDAIGFLMDHDGLKFHEAVKQLSLSVGMVLPKGDIAFDRRLVQRRIDAESMLECMEPELLIHVIVSSDYERGIPVSEVDRQRFLQATAHIMRGIEFVKKRRLFDYERRQIVLDKREREKAAA